jgi:hypothetical protein
MRFSLGDMRDHIVSQKNDHRASYRRCRVLQRRSRLKSDICEIFGSVRFSTFATLSGAKRTSLRTALRAVYDPGCVKTCASRECRELFSPFSSFDCGCQCRSFPIQRNRDKISTRKLDIGVFTQPWTRTGHWANRFIDECPDILATLMQVSAKGSLRTEWHSCTGTIGPERKITANSAAFSADRYLRAVAKLCR